MNKLSHCLNSVQFTSDVAKDNFLKNKRSPPKAFKNDVRRRLSTRVYRNDGSSQNHVTADEGYGR